MRAIKLDVVGDLPPNLDFQFGNTGFVYLGLFAFVYGKYTGPLHWINSKSAIFFPEDGDLVTSFSYGLKPGVTMKYTVLDKNIDGTAGILSGIQTFSPLLGKIL